MYKNYNMNQVILPLDFEMKLAEKDIAFSIHHLVESIPEEAFAPFYKATGCPSGSGAKKYKQLQFTSKVRVY